MSKSTLYAVNSNDQVLTDGATVNFGNVVRRYGCHCNLSGGNAYVKGCGYYAISVNVTANATAAGTLSMTLYKDGVAIPGAVVSKTVAAGSIYNAALSNVIIRQTCDCEDVITAVISGTGATITNAAITVEKE